RRAGGRAGAAAGAARGREGPTGPQRLRAAGPGAAAQPSRGDCGASRADRRASSRGSARPRRRADRRRLSAPGGQPPPGYSAPRGGAGWMCAVRRERPRRSPGSCTWTWTPSSPPSRCGTTLACRACPWWSAVPGRAASSPRPAIRPAPAASARRRRWRRRGAWRRTSSSSPPRIEHYRRTSARALELLADVVADIEQISVDEAFLDVRGARRLFGPPEQIADLLRRRIREELDLPSSVGGSVSRAVAKIASARAKPDGMLIVPAARTAEFLAPLPVSVISGIGPKAQEALARLGVRTIGQLRETPRSTLTRVLGPRTPEIMALADGSDRTGLGRRTEDRSLGTERTWDEDLTDPAEVRRRITQMADDVARQLRRGGFTTRTVVLKLRAPDGTTRTRSSTLDQPTASGERLREHVV